MKAERGRFLSDVMRDRLLYIMIIPTLIWFLIFAYLPMFGIVIAFKSYQPGLNFFSGNWVGLDNFRTLLADSDFIRAFRNTVIISILRIVICLPAAVVLAVLFSEMKNKLFKSLAQSITYIPHFISWVIVAVFAVTLLNPENGINYVFDRLGLPIVTLTDNAYFRYIIVFADMWKDMGFNSVLFMAAILGISPSLYESADIDGAGRMQKILYITLPGIRPTIVAVLVIWIGIIISVGFDQVFNMYNPAVYESGDIIDTYIYRIAFTMGGSDYGVAAAAGVFKCLIAMGLIYGAHRFAKSSGQNVLF